MKLFYGPDYLAPGHVETVEKSAWIVDSLDAHPVPGITLVVPPLLAPEALYRVHGEVYVDAMRTGTPRELAESQMIPWSPAVFTSALASTSGALAAAREALVSGGVSGSLSAGLHHARRTRGAGFCTFNGLALAAHTALDEGARAVLILDLDAHCGGGTWSLVAHEPRIRHVDVSVNDFDRWEPDGRSTLDVVDDGSLYLDRVDAALGALDAEGERFDLCLYNAGVDICNGNPEDPITAEIVALRERRVFAWCRSRAMPAAFVLAGGYIGRTLTREGLVALHRATIEAAATG
jgi:acetoin utilization deacetylase AcuC-like enzyme